MHFTLLLQIISWTHQRSAFSNRRRGRNGPAIFDEQEGEADWRMAQEAFSCHPLEESLIMSHVIKEVQALSYGISSPEKYFYTMRGDLLTRI
jgi:hypothetical protein